MFYFSMCIDTLQKDVQQPGSFLALANCRDLFSHMGKMKSLLFTGLAMGNCQEKPAPAMPSWAQDHTSDDFSIPSVLNISNAVVAETTWTKLPTFKKHPSNFGKGVLFLSTVACKAKGRWTNITFPFSLLKSQWALYRIEITTLPFLQLMHEKSSSLIILAQWMDP